MRFSRILVFFFFGLVSMSVPLQRTEAGLGESADSVISDEKALSAVKRATEVRQAYSIHEFTSGGTNIREYVSPSGIVFGIAWNGLAHPDLSNLLGAYAGEYEAALGEAPRKRGLQRREILQTDSVVVEKWGHMRHLQGRAYAPALLPPGVSADEIR